MSGARRLVVEADGGSRGNPGPAGYGAVVRDADTREVLAERAASIGVTTNNVAEYSGLLAGLEAAAEVDAGAEVEVRMDSKLVVEQMSGRWQIKHADMRRLADRARTLLPAAGVRYTWVPRAENSHADRLANEAMDDAAREDLREPGDAAADAWLAEAGELQQAPAAHDAPLHEAGTDGAPGMRPAGSEPAPGARSYAGPVSTPAPAPAADPAAPAGPERLGYRLLTGTDDRAFCERVSSALADGYELHGGPAIAVGPDGTVVTAQAVRLPAAPASRVVQA